jgi:hypothetical protein
MLQNTVMKDAMWMLPTWHMLTAEAGRKASHCWEPYLTFTTGDTNLRAWHPEEGIGPKENSQWEILVTYKKMHKCKSKALFS